MELFLRRQHIGVDVEGSCGSWRQVLSLPRRDGSARSREERAESDCWGNEKQISVFLSLFVVYKNATSFGTTPHPTKPSFIARFRSFSQHLFVMQGILGAWKMLLAVPCLMHDIGEEHNRCFCLFSVFERALNECLKVFTSRRWRGDLNNEEHQSRPKRWKAFVKRTIVMSANVHVRGCLSRLGPNFVPAFRVSVNAKKKNIYIYIMCEKS